MNITTKLVSVSDLVAGFEDKGNEGVVAYGGKLDVRPPYQREFIYSRAQEQLVIDSLLNGFPLNSMYWAVKSDGTFEVLDGQQRTLSICRYLAGRFSITVGDASAVYATNEHSGVKEKLLPVILPVYLCEGTPSDKLAWFRRINVVGTKLLDQELLNAVYHGTWLADAKVWFSKTKCAAEALGEPYIKGSAIRQEYLETALDWISESDIEGYMSKHQNDPNASALWRYFQDVITWVAATFPVYRKQMKGVNWGTLYNKYKGNIYNTKELEAEIKKLILDDDVTKKSGIWPYVLTGDEHYLSLRAFPDSIKQVQYEQQKGICPKCGETFEIEDMEADHITPWHKGGKTVLANCQMLCKNCNRRKSGK